MSVVLNVQGISKSFGGIHAVRDVSFEVRKGEMLGLIGPNGSGKSTLSYVLSGKDGYEVTDGSAALEGEDLKKGVIVHLNSGGSQRFEVLKQYE